MSFIEKDLYKKIIKNIPILCVDIVIKFDKKYLLVERKENPMKGKLWVPGGRVFIGETSEEAANRKLVEELGIDLDDELMFVGIYEDFFDSSSIGEHLYQTVSIVFQINLKKLPSIMIDNTIRSWKLNHQLPERFSDKIRSVR